jgi:Mg/Co/Ni transporter MgtE
LDSDTESLHKFWHRAGWLILLLMCQSTSSVILEHFDVLIRSHPVVIYFLTMLVGAGGNAGSQSTVLVVRQLALAAVGRRKGEPLDDRFSLRRIVCSEVSVGARLALVLFVGTFVRCVVFQVRGVECLAICLSMLAIVFVSTLVGAALPVLLNRLKMDPAHAGATIQVIMDISGVSLTCVVSCLVLGLPIGGGAQLAQDGNVTAGSAAHGAGAARSAGFSIQHEGMRQDLNQFGGTATAP